MSIRTFIVAAALLGGAGGTLAQDSAPLLEERLNEEVQAVLLRLMESGELHAGPDLAFEFAQPATRRAEFGAIVDARHRPQHDTAGLPVLGVTPGGSAAAIGLRSGDRLLAINGETLSGLGAEDDGRARAALRLREVLDTLDPDQPLRLTVQRDRQRMELQGALRVVNLPSYRLQIGQALQAATPAAGSRAQGCGRITQYVIPPVAESLFPAVLHEIDGKLPGPLGEQSFRIEVGRHVLKVSEAIPAHFFSSYENRLRRRQLNERDRFKYLELDVQPDTTYRIGVRFIRENRDQIRDEGHWEPVVWREVRERCS